MNQDELEKLLKMTKAGIIEHFQHLGSAVQAKDQEITDLKRKHKDELTSKNTTIAGYESLIQDSNRKQDSVIAARVAEATQTVEGKYKNVKEQITNLNATISLRERQLNKVLSQYESLMKIIQGTSDIHSDMFTIILNEIRGENDGN